MLLSSTCDRRKHNAHAHQQASSQASMDSTWRHAVWLTHSSLGFQRPAGRRSYRLTPQATIAWSAIVVCNNKWWWWMWMVASYLQTRISSWLAWSVVHFHLVLSLQSSNKPDKHSPFGFGHDDSIVNINVGIRVSSLRFSLVHRFTDVTFSFK